MTQAELNKKAMADIFALEDSKDLFEAIGGLNDDEAFGNTAPADTEFGVDDMLTVIPGSTDPFAGQSIMSQEQQEPSAEDKKFVIDRFSELMAKDHKDVVSPTEIDSYTPIIQKEVGMRMNVNQFLTDIMNSATQRLSAQNVSEAQPSGAATDEIAPQGTAPEAPVDPAAMGTPAMEPAPGGVVAEPSLDANVGAEPAPGDDLGLGDIDSADTGLDDFGAEPAPEGGDDLGLGDLSDDAGLDTPVEGGDDLGLGEEGGEEPAPEGADDLGLGEEGGEEGGEEAGSTLGDDDELFGDSNLDNLSDDEFGGDDEGSSESGEIPSDTEDAEFEAEMAKNKAILESIHAKYVEDTAREQVRTLVESYVRTKKAEQKAQLEAAEAEKVEKAQFEAKSAEMRNELGDKVAAIVESDSKKKSAAILENAARAFDGAMKRKTDRQKAKKASRALSAKLESISANFHKVSAKEAAAKKLSAKLESISKKYSQKAPKAEAKPMTESTKAPKAAPEKVDSLTKKLQDIVASVK